MNRNTGFLIVGVLALFAFFFWLYNRNQKPHFDWSDSWGNAYSEKWGQPYGSCIAHQLLDAYFPNKTFRNLEKNLNTELPLDSTGQSNYVFVGEALYLDSLDTRHLMDFVEKGNTAFLSSKSIPYDLMFYLYSEECADAPWDDYAIRQDSLVRLRLVSPKLSVSEGAPAFYAVQNQTVGYAWHHIGGEYFCENSIFSALGFVEDNNNTDFEPLVNFAEIKHGKGRFLLHTTPLALSNYQLLRNEGREYVAGLFSRLREGDIYWDAFSRQPEQVSRRRNETREGASPRNLPAKHALTYILENRSLASAWYLLLGLAIIWVLFRAKRRQRIIPVLPRNENSSLEFISTIAHLHFRERDYRGLCMTKMKMFLAHIRERYGLTVQVHPDSGLPRVDEAFVQRLARVSEVPETQIREIFMRHANGINYEPNEQLLMDFHLALEGFFKRAR